MEDNVLMDKRSYFIADRVTVSQAICLLLTGLISFFIEALDVSQLYLNFAWILLIILPIACLIGMMIKKEWLYFDNHWLMTLIFLGIIWASITIYLGVFVDTFVGARNTLMLSLIMIVMNVIGYCLARMLRMIRHSLSNGPLWGIALGISTVIIVGTIIYGLMIFNYGIQLAGITDPFDLMFNPILYQSQTMILGIYIIIMGIGVTISMGLSYYALYALYDPKGLDVEEDPPNELYLKMMIGSLVITFVAWILLLVLFPPLAGGGGGGKSKSRSSSSHSSSSSRRRTYTRTYYYSRYRTYRHYGTKKPRDVYPPEIVDKEWEEHDLGKNS